MHNNTAVVHSCYTFILQDCINVGGTVQFEEELIYGSISWSEKLNIYMFVAYISHVHCTLSMQWDDACAERERPNLA